MNYYREEDYGVREVMLVRGYGDETEAICWTDDDELIINREVNLDGDDIVEIDAFCDKYYLTNKSDAYTEYFFGRLPKHISDVVDSFMADEEFWVRGGIPLNEKRILRQVGLKSDDELTSRLYKALIELREIEHELNKK